MSEGTGVAWREWGAAAFAEARETGKPVMLHIGATWCHWCHVMDEGTYPHPSVQKLIHERFIPVRVDTDHRPDVNERYNQGGWPTLAVLDGDGEVLMGRLYMPPHELLNLLESCSQPGQRWVIGRSEDADLISAPATVSDTWEAVKKAYDPYHHGFGELEKFPHPGVLDWLADRRGRGESDGDMLLPTLGAMVEKGLYDPVEGGFFRYATRDDWAEVHYEKLAEDQARLLRLLLRTGVHRPAAEGVVAWVLRTLWQPEASGFGGSMDASERYYNQTPRVDPPAVDRMLYAGWNAALATSLFRAAAAWSRPGLAVLAEAALSTVRDSAIRSDGAVIRTPGGVAGLLEDQAAVAEAAAWCFQTGGDPLWLDLAARVLAFAETLVLPEGGFRDGPNEGVGLLRHARRPLPANAALGEAAWRLHALTDEPRWLALAQAASAGATAEADRYGFMGAPAAALAERLQRRAVVVKVRGNPALHRTLLNAPDPELIARLGEADVPDGRALACSGQACGRPADSLEEVRRQVAMLRA